MKKVTVILCKREALKRAFCTAHAGKMEDIISISTNPFFNTRCIENAKRPGWICQHCYSMKLVKARKTLFAKLEQNRDLLTLCEFTREDVENIIDANKYPYCRFEAFADLENVLQVKNYFTIAKYNKRVKFALWSKSPDIIAKAMKKYNMKKPGNLQIVYSYPRMNTGDGPWIYEQIKSVYPFINKVFIVNDKPIARVNCQKKCYPCHKCYTKNRVTVIYEKLK